MDIDTPLTLLGGLTPAQFMKRHWHKKPLLVRQAIPGFEPCVGRAELVQMLSHDDVESRLIVHGPRGWTMRHGPLPRRSLPPFSQKRWTFLVQGVDLHHQGVHELLQQFRFVPDARLDDLMISYASDGGGVGPHFDHYDVFLLQAHGRRRWRIGRQKDLTLVPDVPLKLLQNFEPEQEFVLEPGDMLYLPPKWAHDGVAEGECMTWSIGFRSPQAGELARELLQGLAEEAAELVGDAVYRDPQQPAVAKPPAFLPSCKTLPSRRWPRPSATRAGWPCCWASTCRPPKTMSGLTAVRSGLGRPAWVWPWTGAAACSMTRSTSFSMARALPWRDATRACCAAWPTSVPCLPGTARRSASRRRRC